MKDLGLCLEECGRTGLALPGASLARDLYTALAAQGDGDRGTQALLLALERMNGRTVPARGAAAAS